MKYLLNHRFYVLLIFRRLLRWQIHINLSRKKEKSNRTFTSVIELNDKELIEELSRMITGTKLTDTAKEHAKEMLVLAGRFKKSN